MLSVLVVGMSHKSASVSVLEQISMDATTKEAVARALLARPAISESMIISTCNRVEVYVVTTSFHGGVGDIVDVLHEYSGVSTKDLRAYLYVRYAEAATEHLLMVTSGLDSMVIGEQQIIGQVRSAYQDAHDQKTAGPVLHSLAQAALHTGKRVHAETGVDGVGPSVVSLALDVAQKNREIAGASVLVLGAGAMASLAATYVGKAGCRKLFIANRTRERAERLAEHAREAGIDAQAIAFADRYSVLSDVTLVISATGAGTYTFTAADIAEHVSGGEIPQVFVDLSMPRDLDPALAQQACLVNIESLQGEAQDHNAEAYASARALVEEALEEFSSAQRVRDVIPAVAALRKRASTLVEVELDQLARRTPGLSQKERKEVERTVRRVAEKLLHQPTVRAKELAAHEGSVPYEYALQELFGLSHTASMPLSALPEDRAPRAADSVAETLYS